MKRKIATLLFFVITLSVSAFNLVSPQEQNDPWTQQQLLNPADLAKTLNNPKSSQPLIFCVGPQAVIKSSIYIGPTRSKENLDKLKLRLTKLPKNTPIVIYCGCCPFSRCPNVRPAIELLKSMHFSNYKLLNLPQNVKVDWIDPGYPLSE